ncbi:MAG: outer membrane beta-barrel domain-containing protein [Myxococcota bacterium]
MKTASIIGLLALLGTTLPVTSRAANDEGILENSDTGRRRSLAERIPAVSRRFFRKAGRVELTPTLGLSLNDPFAREYSVGGMVAYHLLESLAISVSGEVYLSNDTFVDISGGGSPPKPDFDRPLYAARLEGRWSPLYGKLSVLAEKVLHFDVYLSGGVGVIGPDQGSTAIAGTVALGQHFFVNSWMGVMLELRDQIFDLNRNPAIDRGRDIQHLLTFTAGLSFYLPTEVDNSSL